MDDGCSPLWGCVVFALFVVTGGIFHAFGSALANVRESDVEKKEQEGNKKAKKILLLLDHPGRFEDSAHAISTLLGIITGYIGIGVIEEYAMNFLLEWCRQTGITLMIFRTALVLVVLICTMVILLSLGYLVPKKLGRHHPEKTIFRYFAVVRFIMLIFSPVLWLTRQLSNLVIGICGLDPHKNEDEVTEEEIISMVDEAHEQGVIQENEAEMIQNIFEFGETHASDIMTHRKNIAALDGDMSLEDALKIMLKESYSRYPVYQDDIDNIIGIIHLKDAMKQMTFRQMGHIAVCDIPDLIREVEFVPETRNIDSVFQYMRTRKAHMVIVVDEYGQTAGLVAMEDILEEIVGNILDEYDEEDEMIKKQSDGSMIVNGLTELEDLEDLIPVTFDKEDYETLNGFLINELEHIPGEDEKCVVDYEGYRFTILEVDNNIIQTVKIEKSTEA